MKSKILVMLIVMAGLITTGCTSSGMFISAHTTSVELRGPNYQIVATDITGSAEAEYILGFSYSAGIGSQTIALARVNGTGNLYQEALANLWNNYEQQHGSVTGKKLALVNVRYDGEALNLLLYTRPKVMVRADVVEFVE